MTANMCADVRRWLASAEGAAAAPDAGLVAHMTGCAQCRGALASMLASLTDAPPPGEPSCADCGADLAAYVEIERSLGVAAAARTYPDVWWHLWTCPDCAESAESVAHLLDAEATGLIAAPPALPRVVHQPAPPAIRLTRSFLHAVFAPQLGLGARWHDGDDPLVLTERDLPGCRITIQVRQHPGGQCELEVTVIPPVIGHIIVQLGELRYRAALVDGRVAQVRAIPARALADRSGPDLQVVIERTNGDTALT